MKLGSFCAGARGCGAVWVFVARGEGSGTSVGLFCAFRDWRAMASPREPGWGLSGESAVGARVDMAPGTVGLFCTGG
jgi:hypothetical protein